MSVTNYQQPDAYTPSDNPQDFVSLSNQIAVSDFTYRVICTDLITSETQTYNPKQWPSNGRLVFPARNFAKKYIRNYVPNNVYGFQLCVDAIRKIRVNVGEYYSAAYVAGTNYEYIIWNGVLRALDWVDYDQTDFVYNHFTTNLKYLSSLPASTGYLMGTRTTYSDTSLFIYVLSSQVFDFQALEIKTYNSAGTLLGTSEIANPYQGSATYTDKYVAIDIGHKGLTQIASGLVTGTYPIMTASVAYYLITDVTVTGSPPAVPSTLIARVDVECEPVYDVYTLHYKAKSGNFETLHFSKLSEHTETIEKSYYRKNPNDLASNTYLYTKFTQWETALSSTGTDTFVINTDWLTPTQVAAHREIVSSKEVYIDYGSTIGLVPVKVLNNSILDNKSYNNKLFAIALNIEITAKNNY